MYGTNSWLKLKKGLSSKNSENLNTNHLVLNVNATYTLLWASSNWNRQNNIGFDLLLFSQAFLVLIHEFLSFSCILFQYILHIACLTFFWYYDFCIQFYPRMDKSIIMIIMVMIITINFLFPENINFIKARL